MGLYLSFDPGIGMLPRQAKEKLFPKPCSSDEGVSRALHTSWVKAEMREVSVDPYSL